MAKVRLRSYLRPYWGCIAALIVLLFSKAAVDLNLPNLMSGIVNIGIQRGGITETAPKVVPATTMDILLLFASDEDRGTLESSYEAIDLEKMAPKEKERFLQEWPAAARGGVLRLAALSAEEARAAEEAFQRVCGAMTQIVRGRLAAGGPPKAQEGGRPPLDLSSPVAAAMMKAMVAAIPSEMMEAARKAASGDAPMVLEQAAALVVKGIYAGLGADMGRIQNRYIMKVGAQMLLMTLLLVLFTIGIGYASSRFGAGVARDLRRDIFVKTTWFTGEEFDKFGIAGLITRSTNDVMQIRGLLSMGMRTLLYAPIIGIGGIAMALRKSAGMAWIIALAAIVILCLVVVLFFAVVPRFKLMQKLVDKLNLVSRESLSGMMVIRAFSAQKFEEDRFDKANRDLAANNLFVFRAMATMSPVMSLVMNGVSILIVWVGGHRIAASTMQVGDMMAFIQYTMQIIMSFLMISMMFVMVPRAVVSANRVREVLGMETSIKDPASPAALVEGSRGLVEFRDVSFRYPGATENVLSHINLTALPGETVAVVGSTGSGKSTLVDLIPRLHDATEGQVLVDGVDVRRLALKDLRREVAYIPQKGILFGGTIASNLRLGEPGAPEEALRAAVEVSQAAEFVDKLPGALEAPITQGGTNVSGGQRQRLSIARALVKDAPIRIFDDTFSALDFKTDARLRAALRKSGGGATTFVVAQRISTVMGADKIVVLEKGRVVGVGKHKELLGSCQTYREIAQSQLPEEELL